MIFIRDLFERKYRTNYLISSAYVTNDPVSTRNSHLRFYSCKSDAHALELPLALGFALLATMWSLLGGDLSETLDPDAARHTLNGALLFDMLRTGSWTHPAAFAKQYYAHLPAVSIPYHPPLFPALEAILYALFGFSIRTARLAVACAAGLTIWLLFRLTARLNGSLWVASAAVITFCSLRIVAAVSRDVMLEFPALACVLAAVHCLLCFEEGFTWRPALWFALFASAAVWTKHAIFLGPMPWAFVLVARRWQLLWRWPIWISSALFSGACLALVALVYFARLSGQNAGFKDYSIAQTFSGNGLYYLNILCRQFGAAGLTIALTGLIAGVVWAKDQKQLFAGRLCLIWVVVGCAVPVFLPLFNPRYLIFVVPPLIIAAYTFLYRMGAIFIPARSAGVVCVAIAVAFCSTHFLRTRDYLRGPAEAAQTVLRSGPTRILYCGDWNGSFIVAIRSLDPSLQSIVLRGDKLQTAQFAPDQLRAYAHEYGIRYIVARFDEQRERPWDWLRDTQQTDFIQVACLPMKSNYPLLRGKLYIYRFTDPSPNPRAKIATYSSILGQSLDLSF